MYIKKKVLGELDKVYSTCIHQTHGDLVFIGASEGEGEAHAFINGKKTSMWEGPGGTMNVVPVPGREEAYFATQKFLPVFAAADCTLNCVTLKDGQWNVVEIMKAPYLHRFDLFEKNNDIYIIGATLCEGKAFVQDWSQPGSVYIGKLDNNDLTKAIELKRIYTGITKNHGLCYVKENDSYLVTGVEGVFSFEIPERPVEQEWNIEKIMSHEVSDIAVSDIDDDGELEYATIEPFHGNKCVIYKRNGNQFVAVKEYEIEFGHVIWGGKVAGINSFLLGYRKDKMELLGIHMEKGSIKNTLIDSNIGPSQISVTEKDGLTYILSANRQIGELAVYEITQ